jgi:hypothetical protein
VVAVSWLLAVLALRAEGRPGDGWLVKSAGDVSGTLTIVLRSGRVVIVPRSEGTCSYEQVEVARDGETVGWVEDSTAYPEGHKPCEAGAQAVEAGPVIWRQGRIIRDFGLWGGVVLWSFYQGGRQVSVHAGPAHFDDSNSCTLYDVATGHALKKWRVEDKTPPPDWAQACVYN